jgi:DNA-binding winged helix-turn-helix (wHTH) protein
MHYVGACVVMAEKKIRFGRFELDFARFQLFRAGEPLRLEGLPLRLLMYLADHHGELVTREQIADALWGKDVFVDVEMGINTAIRKVRMALEDDSTQPQYLQTVVGRGYRFVAQFSPSEETSASLDNPKVSLEELGQAIMAAADLHPEEHVASPKDPQKS